MDREPAAGSVRYRDKDTNEWKVIEPRTLMYSTALFIAEEYYVNGKWVPQLTGDNNVS